MPAAMAVQAAAGFALLAAGSWMAVPMQPVPFTLQTLALLLVVAVGGWRVAVAATLLWLAAGAIGAPVFAGGTGGWARLTGAGGGFLLAMPVAAIVVGVLAERRPRWAELFVLFLLGHAIVLAGGAVWLAWGGRDIGGAFAGLIPYLPGALAKSAAGTAILLLIRRLR